MSIPTVIRQQVRERANFACEFCGVTEVDMVGELTIDHYRPQTKGGGDELDNLIYSCLRCNQQKSNYWPSKGGDIFLWNPRQDPAHQHFLLREDAVLHPLTDIGAFTISRLRLNRPLLIDYRLQIKRKAEDIQLLSRYGELVGLQERLT
ncbi:MAG: HNH endonuclease signature motif containing protein [Chloroflexota bacterium]